MNDCVHAAMSTIDQSNYSNAVKNPDEWKTGDETMTGAQASYLQTLCDEAGEEFDPTLTKAEAFKRIDEWRAKTGGASRWPSRIVGSSLCISVRSVRSVRVSIPKFAAGRATREIVRLSRSRDGCSTC